MTDFPSVTAYLSWDHDRLDGLLTSTVTYVEEGDLPAAREKFSSFLEGLLRHIKLEEELLFSVFERRTGMVAGPTQVMRMEHRSIERALLRMGTALEVGNGADFAAAHGDLLEVLGPHNEKEEHLIYPMTDRVLDEGERMDLAKRLLSFGAAGNPPSKRKSGGGSSPAP